MPISRRTTLRVLDNAEVELVEASRHPHLSDLSDKEVQQLRSQLRERRNRAQDLANRTRRKMRGKDVSGADDGPRHDEGVRQKVSILANAVQRVNQETSRRQRFQSKDELKRNAKKALEMRRAATRPKHPNSRRSDRGMRAIPNERAQDLVNRMEVGRVSQFVKDAQAKKDNR